MAGQLASPDGNPLAIEAILAGERSIAQNGLRAILPEVGGIVEARDVQWSVTDWPFEHFWGNPSEPRHSKYLAFFLGGTEAHGCGPFLLHRLFQTTETLAGLALTSYKVIPERRSKTYGQIDLLVLGTCSDGRQVALIIENKVNGAQNQTKQLRRYVEQVQVEHGLRAENIYVLFLPFSSDKEPNPDDLVFIKESGVAYEKITFETHIAQWLRAALEPPLGDPSYPENLRTERGMRDNLRHYQALINYLIKKQKEDQMSQQIIRQLQTFEGDQKALPSWSSVHHLIRSASELLPCLERVLRGKLLFGVMEQLLALDITRDDLTICTTGGGC